MGGGGARGERPLRSKNKTHDVAAAAALRRRVKTKSGGRVRGHAPP